MADSIQEPVLLTEAYVKASTESTVDPPMDKFSLLRLNSDNGACAGNGIGNRCSPCASCGFVASSNNCMKRQSASSSCGILNSSADESEPKPKKHFIEQEDLNNNGFSKIQLPASCGSTSKAQAYPVLRRSFSDPYSTPGKGVNGGSPGTQLIPPECARGNGNVATPSPSKNGKIVSALPPLPPTLRRSYSDTPSPTKHFSPSPCSGGLCHECIWNSERKRRMNERMADMKQWQVEDLAVAEADAEPEPDFTNENGVKDGYESVGEEFVSVEKAKESLIIHFKCPCNKGYQILLHDNCCYYKLM